MTEDLTPEEQQAIAQREAMLLKLQLADDFTGIMCTVSGRRFIWSLLVEFGAFKEQYSESHAMMAYKEGRRQIGLYLIHLINVTCPHQYQVMTTENTVYKTEEN